MSKKQSHPAYEALVATLREAHPALTEGSWFGLPCVKRDNKPVLGAYDGGVVFKLAGEAHERALALEGAVLFDPSGKGRPMRAWVVVGADHEATWPEWAAAAVSPG